MKKIVLTSVLFLAIVGCQTLPYQPYARNVKSKPKQGGIVALKTEHRDEDRAKAQKMMEQNCGTLAVNVLEEGEVVVGQETKSSANTSYDQGTKDQSMGSLFGIPVVSEGKKPSNSTDTSSTTVSVKEWQISYECESGAKKKK